MMTITHADAKAKGLKRYFTGKTCRAGHIAERYASTRNCVECARPIWRSVRHRLGHEIVTVKLRVPRPANTCGIGSPGTHPWPPTLTWNSRLNPMTIRRRRLNDAELQTLARVHCGMSAAQFADYTEDEFVFNEATDEIDVVHWTHRHKIKFLLMMRNPGHDGQDSGLMVDSIPE
jgi:hypothetical protein